MKKMLLISTLLLGLTAHCHATPAPEKPNIVFILADDAGYGDFGFQGSREMKTPHLDALAAQGVRFEQAYTTAAVCGPSRAGLYTGKYQQRFGFEENNVPGYMSHASALMGENMGLPLNEVTVADHMKSLGYATALIGKWHQGNADRYHPTKRGFDYFYGLRGGSRSYFALDSYHQTIQPENKLEFGFQNYQEPEKYLTKALAENAVEYIRRQRGPFFLVLSLTAVHTPMEAEEADLKQFSHLPANRQTLAAMTLAMDREIGKVLRVIESEGIKENTLVVFTNDNGAPTDTNHGNNYPLSGTKANHLEGGIRVPMLMRWPGVLPANSDYAHPVSFLDFLPTFVTVGGGDSKAIKNLDGVNLLPFLLGEDGGRPHQTLFWKKENRGAIRDGDWKLLRFPDRPAELYDLKNDWGEKNDLASEYPDKVKAMYKKLFQWETTLERPLWQLSRKYEGMAMERMDTYRHHEKR
ncbi:sulfatase-like hydrolase/transferase [Aestuariibacter sp. A3R04]|uniref:sulfatase-like hydrolase/transferase n=1 Tax=Aestuariibacter sp. A3R04 TaxID=2841571 RepID=UPI001C086C6B|nr:sulfatase-like hydrolase/transferase [Aestuariibacter sp. A3R04]MBU3021269.1 sulfatase-like hydrolase/transferase [Aestuariibacter sp. A3R04]